MKILNSTPRQDGYWMPAEFERQDQIWMLWPFRPDTWRDGGKPAQRAFGEVAEAISAFEPVTVGVCAEQYDHCRSQLPQKVRVVEISYNDAWMRDVGPTFLINGKGGIRAVDWDFNAWGGLEGGLYFPWDQDQRVAQKVCEMEEIDFYQTRGYILEGGSFHTDGQGTVLTTEMCLLNPNRNPHMDRESIEKMLLEYLGAQKVLWLRDGIDPEETDGHIDNVACFVRPGEVACIWTDDPENPYYHQSREAYRMLCSFTDARGRALKVHKVCLPAVAVRTPSDFAVDHTRYALPRRPGELCSASYLNFLLVNGGVILPQYGDENDALAIKQLSEIFPDRKIVGVPTKEIAYGGGNIHCITQQQPSIHHLNDGK